MCSRLHIALGVEGVTYRTEVYVCVSHHYCMQHAGSAANKPNLPMAPAILVACATVGPCWLDSYIVKFLWRFQLGILVTEAGCDALCYASEVWEEATCTEQCIGHVPVVHTSLCRNAVGNF